MIKRLEKTESIEGEEKKTRINELIVLYEHVCSSLDDHLWVRDHVVYSQSMLLMGRHRGVIVLQWLMLMKVIYRVELANQDMELLNWNNLSQNKNTYRWIVMRILLFLPLKLMLSMLIDDDIDDFSMDIDCIWWWLSLSSCVTTINGTIVRWLGVAL